MNKREISISRGIRYLKENDEVLKDIIEKNDFCNLNHSNNYFRDLTFSIISQQLSIKASRSIFNRLEEMSTEIIPSKILNLDVSDLRTIGISNQKSGFIIGLAKFFISNNYLEGISEKSDEEVISILTNIKGVGLWTAQMFLIFSLNRLDILPLGDVAFKRSIVKNYMISEEDNLIEKILEISSKWGPYKSIAAWYLWKNIDN